MADELKRVRVVHATGGRKLVKQAPAAESDINVLVNRWKQGEPLVVNPGEPKYGDFSNGASYHQALSRVREVEQQFEQLVPARVRQACKNDPGVFFDRVFTAEGRAELEALGLKPQAAPVSAPLAAVSEPGAPSEAPTGGANEGPAA